MSKIVKAPAEVLRSKTEPVDKLDKKVLAVISDMYTILLSQKDPEGVGLAAPQIGVPLRIFLTRPIVSPKKDSSQVNLFINPVITNLSRDTVSPNTKNGILEGCLSMTGYYGYVRRSKSVTIKYQTMQGGPTESDKQDDTPTLIEKTQTFSGFHAQIIQHEYDHLQGILFIDKILEQNGKLYEVKGDDWHQVDI